MISRSFAAIALAAFLFFGMYIFSPLRAEARTWNGSPAARALDYSEIIDTKPGGMMRVLVWLTPPMVPAANAQARKLFDQYVIIGAVDTMMQPNGIAEFPPVGSMQAWGANQEQLLLLHGDDLPPTMQGAMVAVRAALSRSLGAMGQHTQWFTFDAGSVRACEPGQLSVLIDGDTYTYDTPIPGCAPTNGSASPAKGANEVAPAPATTAKAVPAAQVPFQAVPALAIPSMTVRQHVVASGGLGVLWQMTALNPDCSSNGIVTFRTIAKPQHGRLRVQRAKVFPHYSPNNPLSRCNLRRVDGQIVTYAATDGYRGDDYAGFETIYPGGAAYDVLVPIVVR